MTSLSVDEIQEGPSTSLLLGNEEVEEQKEEGWFKRFINLVCESEDDDDEDYSSVQPVSFFQLFRFSTATERLAIGVGSFLSILIGLCAPAHIYLSGVMTTYYVDAKEPAGDLDFLHLIWKCAALYFSMFVFTFSVGYVENWMYLWASERIAQRVRSAFIAAVLSREAFNEDEASSGELSNRLSSNIDRLRDGIGDNIGTFVRSISIFVAGSILSFYLDWRTSLLLIWSGPICLVNSTLVPLLSTSANKRAVDLSEEANGISEEAIVNVKTVVSCNGEQTMIERYASTLRSSIGASTRCGFIGALCDGISSLLHSVFHAAGLWYGAVSYHSGRIEGAGTIYAVVSLAMDSSSSFTHLGPHLMSVMKARAAAAKVYHTIDSVSKEDEDNGEEKLDPTTAEMRLEFDDVSYTFSTRSQPVLQNLSFNLAPGDSIALVGKSGCGKSTTLKLVTRFLSAVSGQILLGGQPLEKYDKKKWRRMVGVVSQEPSLFNGSIRDNICLGRPFSDEEVEEACKAAYAHDFIMGLERGYSTLLGPSGVSLSGGQKQRIAIARAIVSNPRLILLDEATSALDTKSERIVQEALDAASEGRTMIVVAHRLSTIKNVQRVIVMEEGKIVESGGYDELRKRPDGIFAGMIAAQEIERSEDLRKEVQEESEDEEDDDQDGLVKDIDSEEEEVDVDDFPVTDGGLFSLYFFNKQRAAFTAILSLMRGLEMPLLGVSYYFVFSSIKDTEYEDELFWTMTGTILLGVYAFFIVLFSHTVHTYTGESTMNDVRVACFSSLIRRPIAYFDRDETSPSACSVLLSQQPPVAMAIVHNSMSNMIENIFAGCIMAVATFFLCVPNGFTGLVYISIFLLITTVVERFSNKAYNELVEVDKSGELAMEVFDNVATIQQLAVEDHFQERFDEIQRKRTKPLATKIRCLSIVHAINESEVMLLDSMATAVGIYFVYTGVIGIKELYATEFCISILGYCVLMMSESFKDIVLASSAARLLMKLIDPTTKEMKKTNDNNVKPRGYIRAESVSFAYPSRPHKKVLDDINFDVDEGRSLALVGPSGEGKSTIVNLLERFYNPTQGQLYLDDIPFYTISSSSLRSSIALVSQEPVLFRGSIIDNVRLGVVNASEEDVINACRMANAHEFIQHFPEGYSTAVGEKGRSLSGGQKQRIAIARALVRNPRVVVLDEATSALDTQSEQVVREALLSSAKGRTSITIAHRLDTIRHCDEICFVEGGRIVERGTHEELMEKRGRYFAMVEQQSMS